MCLSDGIGDESAFAFLNDLKRKLLQTYTYESLVNYNTFQLTEFTDVIKQYMNYYNTHPLTTKTGELIADLKAAKDVMVTNIEKLLERDNKLNIIATKSDILKNTSINISRFVNLIRLNNLGN